MSFPADVPSEAYAMYTSSNDQDILTHSMSFSDRLTDHNGWSYNTDSSSPSSHYPSYSPRFDPTFRVRKAPPVPVPNLTKKSRGRRVPTISDPDSDGSGSGGLAKSRTFRCSVVGCGKCFLRGEHLKRHVRSIHTHDKPFKCTVPSCGKHFSRRDNLFQHIKIHKDYSVTSLSQPWPSSPQYTDHDDTSDYQRSSTSPVSPVYVSPSFVLPSTPSPSMDIHHPYTQFPANYLCDGFATNTPTNISSLRTEPASSSQYNYALSNDGIASHFSVMQPSPVYPHHAMITPSLDEPQFQAGQHTQYYYG